MGNKIQSTHDIPLVFIFTIKHFFPNILIEEKHKNNRSQGFEMNSVDYCFLDFAFIFNNLPLFTIILHLTLVCHND